MGTIAPGQVILSSDILSIQNTANAGADTATTALGKAINGGTITSGSLSLFQSNGATIAVSGTFATGGGSGGGTPIVSQPLVTSIGTSDLIGISQSGLDKAISAANFINSLGEPIGSAPAGSGVTDATKFWAYESGNSMVVETGASLKTYIGAAAWQAGTVTTLANLTLNAGTLTPVSSWRVGTVSALSNLTFSGGTLSASSSISQWTAGTVSALANLTLSGGTLSASPSVSQWTAGTVSALSNLTLSGGTLSASPSVSQWTAGTVSALANLTLSGGTLTAPAQQWGAGSVASVGFGLAIVGSALQLSQEACATIPWPTNTQVTADTFPFVVAAPWAGQIDSCTYYTGAGTFNIAVQIAGVNVTGLSGLTVNSATPTTTNATAARTFTQGQLITVVTSSVSGSPNAAAVQISFHRTG